MSELNDLTEEWSQYADYRGDKVFYHEDRGVMIISSDTKSTLVKENKIHIEFEGNEHFNDAVKKCDELFNQT